MIRIRSAYPAPKSAPAGPGAGQSAWPQHFRELEIDHDGCTSILRIVPRIESSLTAGLPHIGTPSRKFQGERRATGTRNAGPRMR